MGTKWASNLFNVRNLSDTEMEEIPYPRLELHIHVMCKTIQFGTVVGTLIGTVVGAARRRPLYKSLIRGGKIGSFIGIPAGPIMTELTLNKTKSTDYQVWDRCYRLRYNENQVRVDRTFTFGLLTATAASLIAKYPVVNGIVISIPLSLLLAAFYNGKVADKAQKSVITDEIQHIQSVTTKETEASEEK